MHTGPDLGAECGSNRRVVPSHPQASTSPRIRPPRATHSDPSGEPWLTIRAQIWSQQYFNPALTT